MLILAIVSAFCISLIALGLYLTKKYAKDEKTRKIIYAACAIGSIVIHYSVLVADAICGKFSISGSLGDNMLFPAYPCNIMMWLAFFIMFIKKDTQGYKVARHILFVVGTVCAFCGLCFNPNFIGEVNSNSISYEGVKGVISHVTLLFNCLYLGLFEKVHISTKNTTLATIIAMIGFALGGLITIFGDVVVLNRGTSNPMFMISPAIASAPWSTFPALCILGILAVFIGTTIYEIITLPVEERWFNKLKSKKVA